MFDKLRIGAVSLALAAAVSVPGFALAQATIDPFDDQINRLLDALEIKLGPTETIWQDPNFVSFASQYKELNQKSDQLTQLLTEIIGGTIELVEKGDAITDPRFDEMNLTPEQREEMQLAKEEFMTQLEEFNGGGQSFFESLFLLGLGDPFSEFGFEEEYDYDYGMYVYGWADPYEPVEAGNIVNLMSEVEGVEGEDITITWSQTGGPDVTWLQTDSQYNAAFIVPQYDPLGDDTYLEFEVRSVSETGEDYSNVYVDLVMG